MPHTAINPFVYNSPVRGADFISRDKAIRRVLKETIAGKSQGNIWITGERQIGKTSLLKKIQAMNGEYTQKIIPYGTEKKLDSAFIFANVQGCKDEDAFFNVLWTSLNDHFTFELRKSQNSYSNFITAMEYIYSTKGYYVLFLIDEFDAFIETIAYKEPENANRFLAKLSSLLQEVDEIDNGSKAFGCVFASNHDMKELMTENHIDGRGSGLIVEALNLKWFTRAEVKQLADSYLKGNRIQFSEKEIDLCFGATHGYPYFTQKMLSLMFEARLEVKSGKIYIATVKKEFTEMFKETLSDWGGDRMPIRTLEKLKVMVKGMNLGETAIKMFVKLLEGYLQTKLALL